MSKENSIKVFLDRENEKMTEIQNVMKVINLKGKNWKNDLSDIFVLLELAKFLENEYESSKCEGLETKIPLADYDLLLKEEVDLGEQVLGFYYNSDVGTSYEDYKNIIEFIVEDIKEALKWEEIQKQR